MMPKFYAMNSHCGSKAMSEFRAMEERFDSLDDCCRAKFPHDISNCCKDGGDDCSLSGNLKFIPVRASFLKLSGTSSFCVAHERFFFLHFKQNWQDQVCYIKDENLLANWEQAFAKANLRECCEHNMHYDVGSCCEKSEGSC